MIEIITGRMKLVDSEMEALRGTQLGETMIRNVADIPASDRKTIHYISKWLSDNVTDTRYYIDYQDQYWYRIYFEDARRLVELKLALHQTEPTTEPTNETGETTLKRLSKMYRLVPGEEYP